jgi:hypothetical protein
MCEFVVASDINDDSAPEDEPDLSMATKSHKSTEKIPSKGSSKDTPTRGRGRGRGRGQVGRPRKPREDSEGESPLVGARLIGIYTYSRLKICCR